MYTSYSIIQRYHVYIIYISVVYHLYIIDMPFISRLIYTYLYHLHSIYISSNINFISIICIINHWKSWTIQTITISENPQTALSHVFTGPHHLDKSHGHELTLHHGTNFHGTWEAGGLLAEHMDDWGFPELTQETPMTLHEDLRVRIHMLLSQVWRLSLYMTIQPIYSYIMSGFSPIGCR